MSRDSPFRRPSLDSAVAAFERRIAPLLDPEPADPAGRRNSIRRLYCADGRNRNFRGRFEKRREIPGPELDRR